jgi:aspartyl/asparaginyl-tRNA synthetase
LCAEYKAGEAAADGKHKGKEVHVRGVVKNIRDNPKTGKNIMLAGGDGQEIRCVFVPAEQEHLAKLKKGDEIKVQGVCKGKQGTTDQFTVDLDECKLAK